MSWSQPPELAFEISSKKFHKSVSADEQSGRYGDFFDNKRLETLLSFEPEAKSCRQNHQNWSVT